MERKADRAMPERSAFQRKKDARQILYHQIFNQPYRHSSDPFSAMDEKQEIPEKKSGIETIRISEWRLNLQ